MSKGLTFKVYRDGQLVATETFEREIIKIGRLSSAHLRLEDEKVSRIHAVVELSASGEVSIIDMGSSEGTFVNGQRVNKSNLAQGDEIRLGDTRLVFQEGEEATEAAVAQPLAAGSESGASAESADEQAPPDLGAPEEPPVDQEAETAAVERPTAVEGAGRHARPPEPAVAPPPDEEADTRATAPSLPAAARHLDEPVAVVHHYRVSLPPPRELGELNDDPIPTPANWTIEVRKLWGATVLDVKCFQPEDKTVTVGDAEGVDFFMPADTLPDKAFPIARVVGSDAMLSFNRSATGELRHADGSTANLQDLAKGSKAGQDPDYPDCRTLVLPQDGVVTMYFGNVGFRFRHTSKPAGYLSKMTDRLDYTFLNTILLMLFLFAAMVATFHLRPKSVETSEEELYKVPDRFVQFILTRPKPQKKDLNFLEKLKADIDAKAANSAERYKGAEGKMGLKGRPDTGKRSAVRAIKPDDKEIVGNRGLLAVLGAGGPQGLSTVMGGTGLGGELEGAIGNMFGSQIGNSGGFGGLGLKGTGTGGGGVGNTIGVGRLGTYGRGGGQYGYGTGVARIRRRGESNVNISVGQPIIMGSLSMEIIRRVIHSHRDQIKYCYSKELTRSPNLAGKVSIKFVISPKGYVQQASVASTTMNNAAVERCITEKIRTWKFPEPKGGGIVIVNYPFIFTAGG